MRNVTTRLTDEIGLRFGHIPPYHRTYSERKMQPRQKQQFSHLELLLIPAHFDLVVNILKGGDPMSSEFNLSGAFAMRIAGSAGAASL